MRVVAGGGYFGREFHARVPLANPAGHAHVQPAPLCTVAGERATSHRGGMSTARQCPCSIVTRALGYPGIGLRPHHGARMSRNFAAVRDSARSHRFAHAFCAPRTAAAELSAGASPFLCAAALAVCWHDGTRSEGDKPAHEHLRACCLVNDSACLCDRDKRVLAVAHESCWALGPSPWLQTA